MKNWICLWLVLVPLAILSGQRAAGLTWGGAIDSMQEGIEVYKYDLRLRVNLDARQIGGELGIRYRLPKGRETLRLQLGPWYEVEGVRTASEALSFSRTEDVIDIQSAPDSGWVYVAYSGTPPVAKRPPWSGGFTWAKDAEGNHWQGLSSQNAGGVLFMPCVNHPSKRALEGVRQEITVPKPYVVAANGLLSELRESDKTLTYIWESQYPISPYNINFTTGIFERGEQPFISVSGDTVPMVIYLLKTDADRMSEMMRVFRQSAQTQESYFGPYPFSKEKLGIVHTPYLGMEHQTINAYGNRFRFDTLGGVVFDWLLHHELGHEWWGNKLSVPDWADFWLHEGFCTYGDWLAHEAYGGKEAYREQALNVRPGIRFLRPLVPDRPADTKTAYTGEVYFKGAYVLHSLRWVLGDEDFFDMLYDLAQHSAHSYENQWTTLDFLEEVSDYTNYDLTDMMDVYLNQTEPLKVKLTAWPEDLYSVRWENVSSSLPLEIDMDGDLHTLDLGSQDIFFSTSTAPEIDPMGWYLLEVIQD